ncbi:MAG: hypothetical protein C0405_13050 [Desulfovibrio sp.]|nr:hypothetical protein [Desulfovibrio sp.]
MLALLPMANTPNILDLALLALMAFFVVRALFRGFVREIMGLVGLVAAVVASAMFYPPLAGFLRRVAGDDSSWWDAVAVLVILALVLAVFVYLGAGLARLVHRGPFSSLDRLLGAGAGLVKGVLVSYLILNLLLMALPVGMLMNPGPENSNLVGRSMSAPHIVRAGRYLMDLIPHDLTRQLQERAGLIRPSAPPVPPPAR